MESIMGYRFNIIFILFLIVSTLILFDAIRWREFDYKQVKMEIYIDTYHYIYFEDELIDFGIIYYKDRLTGQTKEKYFEKYPGGTFVTDPRYDKAIIVHAMTFILYFLQFVLGFYITSIKGGLLNPEKNFIIYDNRYRFVDKLIVMVTIFIFIISYMMLAS